MNTKSLLFVVLCFIFAADVNAQELLRITRGCHYDGDDTAHEVYTYAPSQEMQKILQRISAAMGLEPNFILKSANVTNALATTERGQRYILYNTTFLENFKREARTQWAAYSVLAHEIGHHLNNHDFGETDSQRRKKMELAADRFAGNILQKMGATLEEAQAGINSFSLPNETATHPPKSARLEAVANGWKQAHEGVVPQIEATDKDKLAEEWFDKGGKAINNKDYEKAIEYYTEAIRLKPDYPIAFFNRGVTKYNLSKHMEAIADYNQAIRLKSDYADAFMGRGLVNHDLGHYTEAVADYDQAIYLKPDDAKAFNNRGLAKKNLGKYMEAIADFDHAINLKPDHAKAFSNRGIAKHNLGKYTEAIADYDQAIRLNPNDADAFINRGAAKDNLGKHTEAIADFDHAIRLNSNDADAFNNRGIAADNLGKYTEAIANFDQAIRLNPDNASAFYNRGVTKRKLGKYQEAIVDYDRAIQLDPKDAMAYASKGCTIILMNEKSRLGEAIDLINKALGLDSSLSYAKDCKNTALEKLKE